MEMDAQLSYIQSMSSENAPSADNQQERLLLSDANIPERIAWYIVGFTDGEGSFNVSLKRLSYGLGWKCAPSFNISQRDSDVIRYIQSVLKCGTIRFRKDGVGYYEVRALHDLYTIILPFFRRYQLLTKKRYDFEAFDTIVTFMISGKHRSSAGIQQILELRESMNGGGKRKFSSSTILASLKTESPETIRQTRVNEMI